MFSVDFINFFLHKIQPASFLLGALWLEFAAILNSFKGNKNYFQQFFIMQDFVVQIQRHA